MIHGDTKKEREAHLLAMITNTAVAYVVSDPQLPDNPIIMCNDAFIELTGYDRSEIIGNNCRFLRGKDTEAEQTQKMRDAVANRQTTLVEITNYKRDGTPFRNAVMVTPSFCEDGQLCYFLGSQFEVTEVPPQTQSSRQKKSIELIRSLSPQQKRVITEMAKGYMNKQIAHTLEISESTVKMHRADALARMNISTTAEAIRVAVEAGL